MRDLTPSITAIACPAPQISSVVVRFSDTTPPAVHDEETRTPMKTQPWSKVVLADASSMTQNLRCCGVVDMIATEEYDHWLESGYVADTSGNFSGEALAHSNSMPSRGFQSLDNELEDSSWMHGVVRTSLALCSSVYLLAIFFGFLLFGEGNLDDVLVNFDTDLGIPFGSMLNDAVHFSYVAHLVLVFPVVFYAVQVNIDGLIFSSSRPLVQDHFRFASITIALVVIIFLGANYIPSIWDIFQFTGATAIGCVGFIFLAAITLRGVVDVAWWRCAHGACDNVVVVKSTVETSILGVQ